MYFYKPHFALEVHLGLLTFWIQVIVISKSYKSFRRKDAGVEVAMEALLSVGAAGVSLCVENRDIPEIRVPENSSPISLTTRKLHRTG